MKKVFVLLTIHGSVKPEERGKIEKKLNADLQAAKIGETTGGGTSISLVTKQIINCDIDIDLYSIKYIDQLISILKDYNIKEHYTLSYEDKIISFN